jgi:hypothetical protein
MPIRKVQIPPGIDRESTQQSSGPSWYDGNNVRFRDKFAQSIGGWITDESGEMKGIVRGLHSWADFDGNSYQVVGTTWKYYIINGTNSTDITPQRKEVELNSAMSCYDGLNVISITDVDHGASVNDFVVFVDPGIGKTQEDIGGNYTVELLQGNLEGWQITNIFDDDRYYIDIGIAADSGTILEGGDIKLQYKVSSGSLASTDATGWGVTAWGGEDYIPTIYAVVDNGLTTGDTTTTVTINCNASIPTLAIGDSIYLYGLVGTQNGVNSEWFNDKWHTVTGIPGGDALIVSPFTSGDTTGTTGGVGDLIKAYHSVAVDSAGTVGASPGWGLGAEQASIAIGGMRTISMQNFGEDLITNNRGGPLYYYDTSANTTNGVPDFGYNLEEINSTNFVGATATPTMVDSFLVAQGHGHVIALGCNDIGNPTEQNKMLIRWSHRHNPFKWLPTASTEAGGDVLRSGSEIKGGVSTKDEIVVFTDTSVYSMRYVGAPEMYGIQLISANTTTYSRMSAVAVDNSVYFMGNEQFYVYNGAVESLPKNLSNYVFDNINKDMKNKVFAGVNSAFTEVLWFYPTGNSFECNRYVSFNYSNHTWSMGSLDMVPLDPNTGTRFGVSELNRTQWQDSGVFEKPLASYIVEYVPYNDGFTAEIQTSRLMRHEDGTSANSSDISHSIESGEVDLDDGYHYAFYDKLIPDVQLFDINDGATPSITASIQGRDLPGDGQKDASSITIDSFTDVNGSWSGRPLVVYDPKLNATTVRGRARSVSIKVNTNTSGFGWRVGDMRIRIRPDGKD